MNFFLKVNEEALADLISIYLEPEIKKHFSEL